MNSENPNSVGSPRKHKKCGSTGAKRKRSWLVSVLLLTPTLVFLQPSTRADASPSIESVNAVAAAVDSVSTTLNSLGISENVALSVTYNPNSLTIRTSVGIPGALLSQLRSAAAGVQVAVARTPFSVADINAEAARLAGIPGISWVGPNDDYSGLTIGATVDPSSLVNISPFPVDVQPAPAIVNAARNNDGPPPNGGSLIRSPGSVCTAGIGVSYNGGRNFGFTTAEHCAAGTYTGGSGSVLGSTSGAPSSSARDVRIVAASSSTSLVWIGSYNSASSRQTYRAASPPANGQAICTDGAISGERCGSHYVRGINMYANVNGVSRGPGFWTLNETVSGGSQVCAAQPGDSGSPVYNYISDGRLEVRGLLSAVDPSYSTTNCAGNPNYPPGAPPNAPSARAFAININAALSALGATPRTG